MTQEPKDWTGFLQQHQAEMQSRTPKHKVSLGQAMKSASKPWKKYKRTFKNNKTQGGSALSPSSFSETADAPATLPTVGGSTCPFKGGRKGRKGKKTRRSRD